MHVCITGAETTLGPTLELLNGPFSGELGVDELMKRRVALRAGWSQTSLGPPPCLLLERLCGSPGLYGAVRVSCSRGERGYSQRWPLSPWRPSLSNLMYIFLRRERWGEADWHTTASSVCAFYNNTSSRCLCQTNEVQAVKGIDWRWNLLDKFCQTQTFRSGFVHVRFMSHEGDSYLINVPFFSDIVISLKFFLSGSHFSQFLLSHTA